MSSQMSLKTIEQNSPFAIGYWTRNLPVVTAHLMLHQLCPDQLQETARPAAAEAQLCLLYDALQVPVTTRRVVILAAERTLPGISRLEFVVTKLTNLVAINTEENLASRDEKADRTLKTFFQLFHVVDDIFVTILK